MLERGTPKPSGFKAFIAYHIWIGVLAALGSVAIPLYSAAYPDNPAPGWANGLGIFLAALGLADIALGLLYRIEIANEKYEFIFSKLNKLTTTKDDDERYLGVMVPAGPWVQTSSWTEIVKKTREMLRSHMWGQVPAFADIKFLVKIQEKAESVNEIPNDFSESSEFISIDFVQSSAFNWQNFRNDDNENGAEPLSQRASLFDALSNVLSTYVVMPYNSFSANSTSLRDCAPVYPVSAQLIERWMTVLELDRQKTIKKLRRLRWMDKCDDQLSASLTDDDGTYDEFHQLDKDALKDSDRCMAEEGIYYSFSVKFKVKMQGNYKVLRVRYISLFDDDGQECKAARNSLLSEFGGVNEYIVNEKFIKTGTRMIGCYVPYAPDVRELAEQCHQLSDEVDWTEIRVLFNWSYLHVRSVIQEENEIRYTNDSWSFQVASVGQLKEAIFLDEGGNSRIKLIDENSVIPYTMAPPKGTPRLERQNEGNGTKVVFDADGLPTCPSDIFHLTWQYDNAEKGSDVVPFDAAQRKPA